MPRNHHLESSGANIPFLLSLLKHANLDGDFLEVGCGTGILAKTLSTLSGQKGFGTELSEHAWKVAGTRIQCALVNDHLIPHASNTFSLVYAKDVWPMIKDKRTWLAEISRVLKRKGKFITYLPSTCDFEEKPLYRFIPGSYLRSKAAYDNQNYLLELFMDSGLHLERRRINLGTVALNLDYTDKHRDGFFSNSDTQHLSDDRISGLQEMHTGLVSLWKNGLYCHYEWERTLLIGTKHELS